MIVLLEIVFDSFERLHNLHFYTKPLILIVLIVYFFSRSSNLHGKIRRFTLLALVFSLCGDVLLMFVDKSENYFIAGLLAFLMAHLCYIVVFLNQRNAKANPIGFTIILMMFAIFVFSLLYKGLGDMLIPVGIYMVVILIMAIVAYLRKGAVANSSYQLVLVGALFFILSDSIIALNKFYQPLTASNISIMLTYALAQYLIVKGILKSGITTHMK